MRRGGGRLQSIAASPTLVGAVTALIAVVAIFLSYNANNGLPFVPVYRVSAIIENGARLTGNNEVRIGGNRVGAVESLQTVQLPDGRTAAKLNLKLNKAVEPLPADTRVRVRYRSAFGLKYVELSRGRSKQGLREGATIPITQSSSQQEFDDIYNTFNSPTRKAARGNLVGFGNAFAARGGSLNQAISSFAPLFDALRPVMQNLRKPDTGLSRLITELADGARIVAPVAAQQAQLFTNMADTFGAISADPEALKETISRSVPTLETSITALRATRPFLDNLAALSRDLRPGVRALRATLPDLNDALRIGAPVLRRTLPMNAELGRVLRSVERLVDEPATKSSFSRLADGLAIADPLIYHVGPYQTVCNAIGTDFTFLANHLSEEDSIGGAQRQFVVNTPNSVEQQGSLGGYSGIQANGKDGVTGEFKPKELAITHGSTYAPAVDANGNADCQNGQTGYLLGKLLLPGQPASNPGVGLNDFPGLRGPTFPDISGRARAVRP